jgi:hypothetical protein
MGYTRFNSSGQLAEKLSSIITIRPRITRHRLKANTMNQLAVRDTRIFKRPRLHCARPSRDFTPIDLPFDIATCMYDTGIDPMTGNEVHVAKGLNNRKVQRALMQFFKPENWFTVREALIEAGRQDLIGSGCDCLIPAQPPKEAIDGRRGRANEADHFLTVANSA